MLRLAISGRTVRWRPPTGHDDVLLAESANGLAAAVAWLGRSVTDAEDQPVDVVALPVGDVDRLVVARRAEARSDRFVAEACCARCDAPIDVTFSLSAYAEHRRPRPARGAAPIAAGRWRLRSAPVDFRVPTAADVLSVQGDSRPRAALLRACVRGEVTAAVAAAVERAMARLAPTLSGSVAGQCPECAAVTPIDLDARELCFAELRYHAAGVHEDVHLIASTYGWTEDVILALPSERRRRYAGFLAGAREAVSVG